jgi:hypothetical protein
LPSLIDSFYGRVDKMAENGQATLDWGKHEDEILDLFVSQNKILNEVMAHMKEKHNFKATYITPISY